MYEKFFGLKENPFKLVPNPSYLFLSKSHEDALAHLNYAVSNEDGFAKVTGEVGTGKTTLCRAFLENLDDKVEAAYIFNPKLTSLQLLKSINQEFGITAETDNTKDLIDALNIFLMARKARGKKVILLIDEAQNLPKSVLEQLRLLSNLETTQSKLLQIFLVGQPELDRLLESPALRQLKQRISISCRLLPLTLKETGAYIRHRIRVGSRKPSISFPRGAVRKIYQHSNGIPRLVNIACDRTLLTAFSLGRIKLTSGIARSAISDLASKEIARPRRIFSGSAGMVTMGLLILGFAMVWMNPPDLIDPFTPTRKPEPRPHVTRLPVPKDVTPTASPPVTAPSHPEEEKTIIAREPENFGQALGRLDQTVSRHRAIVTALTFWNPEVILHPELENETNDQAYFQLAAKRNGMIVQRISGDLDLLRRLNLPAVLELSIPESTAPVYLTVHRLGDETISLLNNPDKREFALKITDITNFWKGIAYVPWKNFYGCTGEIPTFASEDSVKALKLLLRDIGYANLDIGPAYDGATKQAVMDIQEKNGLPADGVVGPFTKIVLYNEHKRIVIPHIRGDGATRP